MQKRLFILLKYLVAALLIAIPLYPKFPFVSVPGTFVSIRLEDFLLATTTAVFLLIAGKEIRTFLTDRNRIGLSIAFYLIVGLVSTLSAIVITKSVNPSLSLLHFIRRIEYFVPFFIGLWIVREDPKVVGFYFKILVIVILFLFVYGFGQKSFQWPIIITQNMEYSKGVALRWIPGSHINSTFAGHYDLATFLVLALPILAVGASILKGTKTKLVLWASFFAGLWLMANAVSRISIVSYLMSVSIALILVRRYRLVPIVAIISIILFSLSSNLLVRYSRIFDVVKSKISSEIYTYAAETTPPPDPKIEDQQPSNLPEDRSSSIRLNVEWPRAIRAFSKNPILGTGYSSITLATDNDYLRLLGETGLLGFLAFVAIFISTADRFLKSLPFYGKFSGEELVFVAGVFGAIPGLLLNAFFIDIFEASKFAILFWLILGFAIGILKSNRHSSNSERYEKN